MSQSDSMKIPARSDSTDLDNVDIHEKGRSATGEVIVSDRRLFMQFHAFDACAEPSGLIQSLEHHRVQGALYLDINDPQGVGLITYSESPDYFLDDVRAILTQSPFCDLVAKPEYTMFGRTYAIGYEPDLDETPRESPGPQGE